MPDDSPPGRAGGVVRLSAEDDPEDTIRPRLEADGADLDRVVILESVTRNGRLEPFTIPDHVDCLDAAVESVDAALVVFDPITSYFSKGIDYAKDTDVRRALRPLKDMAAKHRCAVNYLRHLNKGGGTRSLYRGGGSIAFVGAARSGLLVARDPSDDRGSVLAWVKGNVAERPPSLRFGFEPTDMPGIVRIAWKGGTVMKADELLEATTESAEAKTAVEEACEFLRAVLAGGPRTKADLIKLAREHGIGKSTLERARERVAVRATQPQATDGTFAGSTWSLTRTDSDDGEDDK